MVLNYSQSWDYYLIPVQCVSCQICARPPETNLVFARGTQQLYFKLKLKKRRMNCFLMGVCYISSRLQNPPFLGMPFPDWVEERGQSSPLNLPGLVPPRSLSYVLTVIGTCAQRGNGRQHSSDSQRVGNSNKGNDHCLWMKMFNKRNFMCQSTIQHNHIVMMVKKSTQMFANPL